MNPRDFEQLKHDIESLKSKLGEFHISEICGYAFLEMRNIDWSNPEKHNLTSPYQQCSYIVSLAMLEPQSATAKDCDKADWIEICKATNSIFDYYGLMYFPENFDFSQVSDERHEKVKSVLPSFLLKLCTGVLASAEQIKDHIRFLYSPFNTKIKNVIQFDIETLISIGDRIFEVLQSHLDGMVKMHNQWLQFRNDIDRGMDAEQSIEKSRKMLSKDDFSSLSRMGTVNREDLLKKFSDVEIDSFLTLFAQSRTSEKKDFLFPTEQYSVASKPLIECGNKYFLVTPNHLYLAIQELLFSIIQGNDLTTKFNLHKGRVLEDRTLTLFKNLFGSSASYYNKIYENQNLINEHDLVILYKETLLIVECKDKKIQKCLRDYAKSFDRIKSGFKDSIQEGYEQAQRLKDLVLSQEITKLYDKKRRNILTIDRRRIKNIECIIVTQENEGILAVNLNLLLKKEPTHAYPYCINFNNLTQLIEFKDFIKLSKNKFLGYLKERKLLHEKAYTDDELEMWGYFLKNGSFKSLIEADKDFIVFTPENSVIFDEAYYDSINPKSVENPGKNNKCHCGSDKKYRKCHGQKL